MPQFVRAELQQGDRAFAKIQSRHHGVPGPFLIALRRLELVHDQFYEVAFVAVQSINLVQREYIPVHSDIGVASFAELVEQLAVMSLAPHDQRSEQIALLALIFIHYEVHDLRVRVAGHLLPRDR